MPSCIEQKTKKYRSRGSPPYSAMDCKGLTKTGNDGSSYISKPDKRGIYRWVVTGTTKSKYSKNKTTKNKSTYTNNFKSTSITVSPSTSHAKCTYKKNIYGTINVSKFIDCIKNDTLRQQLESGSKPKNIYEINDNASFPFVVLDYGGRVEIYNNHFDESTNNGQLDKKLIDVKYEEIFIGDNYLNDPYWIFKNGVAKGNTILLDTGKGKYMFIGKGILSFSAINGDIIRKFYSSIGGNYDSFSYAVGDKYVYLLNDKKYASIDEFDIKKDICIQYYCYEGECKKYKTMNLPMKTIYAPFYGFY
jgi:hypothetical protein